MGGGTSRAGLGGGGEAAAVPGVSPSSVAASGTSKSVGTLSSGPEVPPPPPPSLTAMASGTSKDISGTKRSGTASGVAAAVSSATMTGTSDTMVGTESFVSPTMVGTESFAAAIMEKEPPAVMEPRGSNSSGVPSADCGKHLAITTDRSHSLLLFVVLK